MNRGIDRQPIFSDARSYEHFVACLAEMVERFRFRIHAYCLMSNHYHAIIQTPDANLSQGMQWLGLSHSSWFNARHNRVGPVFQGRFKSVPVEGGAWALDLSLYVHLNPVRVEALGLDKRKQRAARQGILPPPSTEEASARLKKLREYPWSSYRSYAGYQGTPNWLTTSEILRRCAGTVEEKRRSYRTRVQRVLRQGVEASKLEQFRDVVAIGSNGFVDRIKHNAKGGSRETERRGRLKRRIRFEDVLRAVEVSRGESRSAWLARHGDWGKWMVLRVARTHTGMTLAELGEAIGGKDYAAVAVGLKTFDRKYQKERGLQDAYRAIAKILNL